MGGVIMEQVPGTNPGEEVGNLGLSYRAGLPEKSDPFPLSVFIVRLSNGADEYQDAAVEHSFASALHIANRLLAQVDHDVETTNMQVGPDMRIEIIQMQRLTVFRPEIYWKDTDADGDTENTEPS